MIWCNSIEVWSPFVSTATATSCLHSMPFLQQVVVVSLWKDSGEPRRMAEGVRQLVESLEAALSGRCDSFLVVGAGHLHRERGWHAKHQGGAGSSAFCIFGAFVSYLCLVDRDASEYQIRSAPRSQDTFRTKSSASGAGTEEPSRDHYITHKKAHQTSS